MTERVIVLLDMDCFYVQVEERDYPYIKGKPAAVVQYNTWKGGGIIAVNYEARACGVKRGMRGDEAKEKCPTIHLVTVPVQRGKADLTKYRNAGSEVISILCEFSDTVERASIDEAYIDLTKIVNLKYDTLRNNLSHLNYKSTWVVGYENNCEELTMECASIDNCVESIKKWLVDIYKEDKESIEEYSVTKPCNIKLGIAALICEEIRAKILETTGFKCSAGISHNKVLGKLACGLHKPNQQTILPMSSVPILWEKLPVSNIRNLGGKLGDSIVNNLSCKTMADLSLVPLAQLKSRYDNKTAFWLYFLGKGIDSEPVTSRLLAKSIGCSKNFIGKDSLNQIEKVQLWMKNLSEELSDRLIEDKQKNQRVASNLSVHVRLEGESTSLSRTTSLTSYKADHIARIALNLIQHSNTAPLMLNKWTPAITNLSLSAGKFEKSFTGNANIKNLFCKATSHLVNDTGTDSVSLFSNEDTSIIDYSNSMDKDSENKSLEYNITDQSSSKDNLLNYQKTMSHSEDKIIDTSTMSSISSGSQQVPFYEDFIETNKKKVSKCDSPKSPVIVQQCSKSSFFLNYMAKSCKDIYPYVAPTFSKAAKRQHDNEALISLPKDNNSNNNTNSALDLAISPNDEGDLKIINAIVKIQDSEIKSKLMDEKQNAKSKVDDSQKCRNFKEYSCYLENSFKVNIKELFPDFSNIDQTVLAILPQQVQKEVAIAVKALNSNNMGIEQSEYRSMEVSGSEEADFIKCETCNEFFPAKDYIEHSDYHFAVGLRKEQVEETKKQLLAQCQSNSNTSKFNFKKSKRMRLKSSDKNICKIPKIDSFFCKRNN